MEDNKQLPIITEHFIKFYKEHSFKIDGEYPSEEEISEFINNPNFIESMKCLHEYAVLYARHHVAEALKAAIKEFNQIELEPFNPSLKTLEDRIFNAFNIEDIK